MPSKKEHKLISKNRSAHHEYFIDETIECGVELAGAEVKSIRERACQITDTFAIIRGGVLACGPAHPSVQQRRRVEPRP